MRDLKVVQQDYADTCAKLGDLQVAKTRLLNQADEQMAPLHTLALALVNEMNQIRAVQDELAKTQKQDA